jgi:ferredoxin, 2Fe-2S
MPRVTFLDVEKTEDFPEGQRLLLCFNAMGIKISQVCGGDGACGTCRVEVVEGWDHLTPPTPDEICKELEAPYRLSCQSRLKGDVVLKIAKIV